MVSIKCGWIGYGVALLVAATNVHAQGKLGVSDAWVPAAPPGVAMMAGYAKLKNTGDAPVTVSAVKSDNFHMVSLHETVIENDVVKMPELQRLVIAPGETVSLQRGGKHLMLMHPHHAIAPGDKVAVTFLLDDGTRVETRFDVRAPDSEKSGDK
ncbi:MAG: copper chaperone PCu(A)C [Rhodanobacter sp.]|nr:copper chaperone PCu(A)C [Rhodanobacter sp.]